jgi:parvulin-like peptidyl-prolyl isomerase
LQHTKKRVIKISVSLLITAVILFFAYVFIGLYKLQSTSTFLYGVTQVLPLPVAKAGGAWVSYESYLFELRHYMHYYATQQQVNFDSSSGKEQLTAFRKQALQQVINAAYVKQIAAQHQVSVSDQDIDKAVALLREQNRLGSSDQEFSDVLKEFWGWSVDDFRRELKQQLLAQKVVATLGTKTNARAQQALAELTNGKKFEAVAKKYSDDATSKANGGEYAGAIDRNNRDLAPQVVDALFKLKPGKVSGVIDTGYTLEIVKVLSAGDGKVHGAHIAFNYEDISVYIKPQEAKRPAHRFISVH